MRPNVPPDIRCSCKIGSTVPKAVVVSASATGTKAWTYPTASSIPTVAHAATAEITQPSEREPTRSSHQQGWLYLESGEQKDEPEPDVGDQLQCIRVPDSETHRSDGNAADDQDHDLWHRDLRDEHGDQRCQGRHRGDDEELEELVENLHPARLAERQRTHRGDAGEWHGRSGTAMIRRGMTRLHGSTMASPDARAPLHASLPVGERFTGRWRC